MTQARIVSKAKVGEGVLQPGQRALRQHARYPVGTDVPAGDVGGTRLVIQFVAPSKGRLDVLAEKANRMFDTMTIGS